MKFGFLTMTLLLLISFCNATDWSNKQDVLAAVKQNGGALEFADASLKKDKDILKAAGK